MSEVQLVNGVLTLLFSFVGGTITALIVRDEMNFRKYQSLLTFVKRYGMLLTANQYRAAIYRNAISVNEMLKVQAHIGQHEIDDDGRPISKRDSDWSHTKVDLATGSLKAPLSDDTYFQ